MDILFKAHHGKEFFAPSHGSEEAAGWDLSAAEDTVLRPFEPKLVPCNFDLAIPKGHMLLVLPRSGNSLRKHLIIPNSPGLIDADYRGHLQVILTYLCSPSLVDPIKISKGDRIAQAILVPYVHQNWVLVDQLPPTQRGTKGFGSTGE